MAIARAYLGKGWAFPVRPTGGGLQYVEAETDIEQAIGLVLETTQRERVMVPAFGTTLRDRVFDSNAAALCQAVEQEVNAALRDWEPRIVVEKVTATAASVQPHVLLIEIDYVVVRTNAAHNLVYPFYLSEGT